MAEIKIQEKRSHIWGWIIGAILAGVVLWLYLDNMNNNSDEPVSAATDSTAAGNIIHEQGIGTTEEKVNSFIMFVETSDTVKRVESSYVKEGLTRLQKALEAVVDRDNIQDSSITAKTDSLEKFTGDIDEEEAKQSNNLRTAFVSAADILEAIEQKGNAEIETRSQELEKQAKSIDGRKSIVEQGEKIKKFFSEAGEVLRSVVPREV